MRICTVTGNKEKGVKIMPRPYLGDPKYTIEVLQKYNFAFQKRFGQNFLIDTHVLDKIIDSAQITKDDFVLEIGPCKGTEEAPERKSTEWQQLRLIKHCFLFWTTL